jgi:TolB protein
MLGDSVTIFDPATGKAKPARESAYGGFFQGWHPDNRQILYVADTGDIAYSGLWLFDYENHVDTFLAAADPGILIRSATISPDGQKVIYFAEPGVRTPGGLWQVNADGSNPKLIKSYDNLSPAYSLSWSPSGKWIAYFGAQGLTVMNPDGSEQRSVARDAVVEGSTRPLWSPDGRYLAYVAGGQGPLPDDKDCAVKPQDSSQVDWDRRAFCGTTIHVVDITTWENRPLLSATTSGKVEGSTDPAWSPDGKMIAFASLRGGQPGLWVINVDGIGLRQLAGATDLVRFPVWMR